jgi:hypothetical protein
VELEVDELTMAASPSPAAFAGHYPRRVDQRLQCDVCKAAKTTLKCAKYGGGGVCNPGTGFICSSGWLSNFEKRYSTFSCLWHGEAGSAPAASAEFATSEVRELLPAFPDKNGENPVDAHPQHGRLRPVLRTAAQSHLGEREGCRKRKGQEAHDCGSRCECH